MRSYAVLLCISIWLWPIGTAAQTIVADCITVADGAHIDDALEQAALLLPAASTHNGTESAITKLSECLASARGSKLTVVGHGFDGGLCTGVFCSDDKVQMTIDSESNWEKPLKTLSGKAAELLMLACDIGMGSDGEKFLKEVARVSQMTVFAVDSFVTVGPSQFEFEPNAEWVKVDVNGNVTRIPVQRPMLGLARVNEMATSPWILTDGAIFEFADRGHRFRSRGKVTVKAEEIADMLAMRPVFKAPGLPLARKTGVVSLRTAKGVRKFPIYNDRFVLDTDTFDYYALRDAWVLRSRLLKNVRRHSHS